MVARYILIYILLIANCTWAQTPEIRILSHYNTRDIQFRIDDGSYNYIKNDSARPALTQKINYHLVSSGGKVYLKYESKIVGTFDTLIIHTDDTDTDVSLTMSDQRIKSRRYSGNFHITSEKGYIKIINKVTLPEYLSGVIETEGGGGKHPEYYKVQAVLSRTYYIGHLDRHEGEGFQLCDEQHCQAYKSKLRFTPEIKEAVTSTQNLIAVDSSLELVSGLYSANCGGQTTETDWIWNNPVNYLRTTKDTFCIHTYQSKWTKKIPKWKWKKFMIEEYNFPIDHPFYKDSLYTFHQPDRKAFYHGQELGIPLRDMRIYFKLKSTYFSCYPEGEYVIVEGRGFGHGAGMCQEGAMNMAKRGFNYRQIFHFYFTNVRLMDYHLWMNFTNFEEK